MIQILKKVLPFVLLYLSLPAFTQDNYKVVIDYNFDGTDGFSSNGLAPVSKAHKWGYIDQTGKVIINYQFDSAIGFSSDGLAAVLKGEKWGYIDQTGEVIIDYQFQYYTTLCFRNGLAAIEKGDKWGYIDKTGKVVIDYQFDYAMDFSLNGLAAVEKGDKWGFIDKTGKIVIACKFDAALGFSSNSTAAVEKGSKWGFIDQTGKVIIDYHFDYTGGFSSDGLATVKIGSKWGYIDQTGDVIIDSQYSYPPALNFSNGLAPVKKGGKWGYINKNGKEVIDYQFDNALAFSLNELAAVVKGGKVGFIDQTGEVIIDYQFDDINNYQSDAVNKFSSLKGLIPVKKDGKWGYIDQTGKAIINYQFDYAGNFSSNGLASVLKGFKWGFIKQAIPAEDITEYVKAEIVKWQEKGKYETTEAYMARVTEANRKKKLEELMIIAVQNIAPNYCRWEKINAEYDADNQTFKANVAGLQPFYIKVPVSEAESFDAAIVKLQFSNIKYGLGSDGKLFLQSATILNPNNSRIYNFSSSDKAEFAYTQFKINLEPLNLNPPASENVPSVKNEIKEVTIGLSDVDVNIPVINQINDKTFAVIIANENYQKEVKVQYAANDGKVFKEYCEKTLGIPSKNIHFVQDASFGNMRSEIKWITDVASAFAGQAKIIFYYAGHGMPNEADKSAYLLPVDGFSSDYETAIKLEDLYNRLTASPSQSVTVFLDACFSGSVRDDGMLANARGVRIAPQNDVLKGDIIVFTAATGNETAYPYKEKQHGLFTYFLLKKLQETKGDVDCETLSNYIRENVKQQSIIVNQKSQTPQVNSSNSLQNTWQSIKLKK